ncbi:toll/interleukin-1 receptor domain-containing protein [candidate division KSB1 bacterium]|nr:toll/interleukin-1 receptor domain-containing protein [candidate division KSB1 bacterium]
MANPEHLTILNQGTNKWNEWRKQNPEAIPDFSEALVSDTYLSGINFSNANFTNAYLNRVDLYEANLRGANFDKAHLFEANLTKARLFEANLSNAYLNEANFRRADLRKANLKGAHFVSANLTGANLREANFESVELSETIFGDTDLTGAKHLDLCIHIGPSVIDPRTIVKSGKLPLAFLRGCGLSDSLINQTPLLRHESSFQFHSCFISYSHQDEAFAKQVHNDLQNNDVRCWFAPEDMQSGKKIFEQITQAIETHDRLLLILSENSMNSEWVKAEIKRARKIETIQDKKMLFPIRLVDYEKIKNWKCIDAETGRDLACEIQEYFVPDFSNWKNNDFYQKAFQHLLRDLKASDRISSNKSKKPKGVNILAAKKQARSQRKRIR